MMGGVGGFGMILWVVLIGALVWWVIQATTAQKGQAAPPAPALRAPREVLDERLARGEITVEQYRELRKALE